jgi:hypothetical protein
MKATRFYITVALLILSVLANAQKSYWQQELNYDIDVTLNDKEHTLDGFLKLNYQNNSPDTLHFIWFHLWPNAFRNDRTAFSEQLLENGKTDFYFAPPENRGYMNRLDFRSGNQSLKTEEDPVHIELLKVYLSEPLAPGKATQLQTGFHVKLPFNYSRGGFNASSFQITQWYPSPAVYDQSGWHPMPYLDQGEFYSEFASFRVQITLPDNFVVAATGVLKNPEEMDWLKSRRNFSMPSMVKLKTAPGKKPVYQDPVPSATKTKTLVYEQNRIHDFAWFADKTLIVQTDTIQLPNGHTVNAFSFYEPGSKEVWKNSLSMMKDALLFRSRVIGPYPYSTISAIEAPMGFAGGMEYPTITSISPVTDPIQLESVLEHEIGHNWFQGMLASNEREHPWLDEGLNTYYDLRYNSNKNLEQPLPAFLKTLVPGSPERFLLNLNATRKRDQPITTSSEKFNFSNYNLVAYYKTAYWMQSLEKALGRTKFDSLMQLYFQTWKFKHPQPDNFLALCAEASGNQWPGLLNKLQNKGPIDSPQISKSIRPALFISLSDNNKTAPYAWAPVIGYNSYDGLQPGILLHNYNLPPTALRFAGGLMLGLKSKQPNLFARTQYSAWHSGMFEKSDWSLSFFQFSTQAGTDSTGGKIFKRMWRLTPSIRLSLRRTSDRSESERFIEFKSFIIGEQGFKYKYVRRDSTYHPYADLMKTRYLNQLTYMVNNTRTLYPYDLQLQLQQGDHFYRASATANYFFNYATFGGANIRLFAAKFGYIGNPTSSQRFATYLYQPKLTANRGDEDYTYSNYFLGRNEQNGLGSQQILERDGNLHLRTDLFQGLQGRSENWVAAINLNTSLPQSLVPSFLPMKLFLDLGTHAEAWKKGYNQARFLYVGGLQFEFLKKMLKIYVPLVYSPEFGDQLKTVPQENKLGRKISFSLNIQNMSFQKIFGKTILP